MVFVPGTAIGDEIIARVVKVRSGCAYGIIEEITSPSPHRIDPDCPVFGRCGGCSLRHMDYRAELEIKGRWVKENLLRIGGIDAPMESPVPSPRESRYRNKAAYPIRLYNGKTRAGFFAKRSHAPVPVGDCLLQPQVFGDIAGYVCDWLDRRGIAPYDEKNHSGLVRTLYLRIGEATGQIMACIVINGSGIPGEAELAQGLVSAFPGIKTILLSENRRRDNVILGDAERVLYGDGRICDILCGIELSLSARSFYQVNRGAAELLYKKALEYAAPKRDHILLDLYCGAGAIGLSMAKNAGMIIGVESVAQAAQDARRNAAANAVANARFYHGDAADAAQIMREIGRRPDTVILDPPRKGISPEAIAGIIDINPQKIVYISCSPATLARDCKLLAAHGYAVVKACAVDLFPRTAHIEAITLLENGN